MCLKIHATRLTYTPHRYIVYTNSDTPKGIRKFIMEQNEIQKSCCSKKTKQRSAEEVKGLLNRLCRIEGQIRGLKKMLEGNEYCTDILIQASAANAALNSFSKALLSSHIRSCVVDDIRAGKDEILDELMDTMFKLMK